MYLILILYQSYINSIFEGSLDVKIPTIWRDEKAEVGRVREEKRSSEKIRAEKSEKKEKAGARKGREVAIHCVFPMICGSGWSKSRLAKAAGAEPPGQMKMKNCTPLWREAHFQVKSVKKWQARTTLGSWDVEKAHAVVARSTFPSQNVKTTTCLDHFLTFRRRKVDAVVARSTFPSHNAQNATCTDHVWRLRCGFAWPAQGIVHLVKSEQNVRVL